MLKTFQEVTDKEPRDPSRDYIQRLKIAVWPMILRYKAGEDKDDVEIETGQGVCPVRWMEGKNGYREVVLGKGVGVYYYGRRERTGEDHVGLGTWQKRKEREFGVVRRAEKRGWFGGGCGIQ